MNILQSVTIRFDRFGKRQLMNGALSPQFKLIPAPSKSSQPNESLFMCEEHEQSQ